MDSIIPSEAQLETMRARLRDVREEIADAAKRSGRTAEAIRLVAVTKTQSASVLEAIRLLGVSDIGENYLQEAEVKFHALGWPDAIAGVPPVQRHMIGHIQSNKAQVALRCFDLIETVDSLALAQRLDRLAGVIGTIVPALLQVNISQDEKKYGFFFQDVEGLFLELAKLSHIKFTGLMTIGRLSSDKDVARADFAALRSLRDRLRTSAPPSIGLEELSMGMSHDFTVAIEEGATMVRIGSRLFGPRP